MNVQAMYEEIGDNLNRPVTPDGLLTPKLCLRHLQNAYQYIARSTQCFQLTRTISVDATGTILLTPDTITVMGVKYGNFHRLRPFTEDLLDRYGIGWREKIGHPESFVRSSPLSLQLVPHADITGSTATVLEIVVPYDVTVITDAVPQLMQSSDVPLFPDPYGRLVVTRAIVTLVAHRFPDDSLATNVASTMATEYAAMMNDFKSDMLISTAFDFAPPVYDQGELAEFSFFTRGGYDGW